MKYVFTFLLFLNLYVISALQAQQCQDNVNRSWWDVKHYVFDIRFDIPQQKITGTAFIHAHITKTGFDTLQIDLQAPMQITSATFNYKQVKAIIPIENGYKIAVNMKSLKQHDSFVLAIDYVGAPRIAAQAPWDGGLVIDSASDKTWWAMAVQGTGASTWLPCKDYADDEPDHGATLRFTYPRHLNLFTNGKIFESTLEPNGQKATVHRIKNPINLYSLTFYLGEYKSWEDSYSGKSGLLPLTYAVKPQNEIPAIAQFKQVKKALKTFEDLYGPYPFYEDGLKIIEAPYLGMEHQGAIAYGNGYKNGYLGKDRSGSDSGLLFDFILIHELAHEWFGNNITALHPRDNWIQEGFTTYAEVQYLEKNHGEKAAMAYHIGKKPLIKNDAPLVDTTDACANRTSDQYDKGAYIVHMLRRQYNDDDEFQDMLRGLNKTFRHQVITSQKVEAYFQKHFEYMDLKPFFKQYLHTTAIPQLVIREQYSFYTYHFENVPEDFEMIIPFISEKGNQVNIKIGTTPKKTIHWPRKATKALWDEYLIEIVED